MEAIMKLHQVLQLGPVEIQQSQGSKLRFLQGIYRCVSAHAERIRYATLRLQEAVGAEIACDLPNPLGKNRGVLDPMAVTVDHGVVEILPDLFRRMVRAHLFLPEGRDGISMLRASVCSSATQVKPSSPVPFPARQDRVLELGEAPRAARREVPVALEPE